MSLSHLEGRPRIETPCHKAFQTKTEWGWVRWVQNRIFWWVASTPFPTPQLLHALIKVRSVKNFKGSPVWQTVIKQEIEKKKKICQSAWRKRSWQVLWWFCFSNQQTNCRALPPSGKPSLGCQLWRSTERSGSKGILKAWNKRLHILSGDFSSSPPPTPSPQPASAQLQSQLLPHLLPKRKMWKSKIRQSDLTFPSSI